MCVRGSGRCWWAVIRMALRVRSLFLLLRSSRPYSLYILVLLMVVYFLNQVDRFVLGITSKSISKDLEFGQFGCFPNVSALQDSDLTNLSCVGACVHIRNETKCELSDGVPCVWDYSPTGIQYQVLAGPAFMLFFTLVAIPLGVLAGYSKVNRKAVIAVSLVLWSTMTLLAGFTTSFWQLLLTRIGLGIFEAVCTPFASSIITDSFQESFRATALGFYSWGIYLGYSAAFAFNFILLATSWRWVFWIAAIPGFLLGPVVLLTLKEPSRQPVQSTPTHKTASQRRTLVHRVVCAYINPPLLLLCIAGGVRQGGGLVWAYNVKAYFTQYYCGAVNIGAYMSWVPLLGGTAGAILGGVVSDRLAKTRGFNGRLVVLISSQLVATPFLVGAIFLPPSPWAFLSLLPAYVAGEMWIGVCLAVVIDLVPRDITSAAVALFLFVINNIGGVMTLVVPYLEIPFGLRYTLLVLFPGLYLVAASLFAVTYAILCSSQKRNKKRIAKIEETRALIQAVDSSSSEEEDRSEEVDDIDPEWLEPIFIYDSRPHCNSINDPKTEQQD